MELELVKFIKENDDWKEKLEAAPYCLKIKNKDHFWLFYYSQIHSDFSYEIVREARGLILDDTDWSVARFAFKKFFNSGEPNNHIEIDWSSAVVSEKVDGSLVSCWWDKYENRWIWATSKNIDAHDAILDGVAPYANFYELIKKALQSCLFDESSFCRDFTYNFELVSPYNRVVIPYNKPQLYFLGSVNNKTLEEIPLESYPSDWLKPQLYQLSSLKDCKQFAAALPWNEEGLVVRDKYFNRIKVKSPGYVMAHYIRNNNVITQRAIIEVVLNGEEDEFLTYADDYADKLKETKEKINKIKYEIDRDWQSILSCYGQNFFYFERARIAKIIGVLPAYSQNFVWVKLNKQLLTVEEYVNNFNLATWEKLLRKDN